MSRRPFNLSDLPPEYQAQAAEQLRESRPLLESEEQTLVISWADQHEDERLRWLFHVPNGGHRDKRVAANLKAEGVRRGVPDLWLPIRAGRFNGLVIEMKRSEGGVLSPEQKAWLELLHAQGWRCVVAPGADVAMRVIAEYLEVDV